MCIESLDHSCMLDLFLFTDRTVMYIFALCCAISGYGQCLIHQTLQIAALHKNSKVYISKELAVEHFVLVMQYPCNAQTHVVV